MTPSGQSYYYEEVRLSSTTVQWWQVMRVLIHLK